MKMGDGDGDGRGVKPAHGASPLHYSGVIEVVV